MTPAATGAETGAAASPASGAGSGPRPGPASPPAARLATHEVTNQPPPFGGLNLYTADRALREAVRREAGDWLDTRMERLGAEVGTAEVLALGDAANRFPPEFLPFDRWGRRLDELRFHPAYHRLMALAMAHRIHDLPWIETAAKGRHLGHMAMLALFTQAEAGVMCPVDMTCAAVPALRRQPDTMAPWLEKLIGGSYDAPLRPIAAKAGITLGMAMTEKQGGSDLRATTTRAFPVAGEPGLFRLVGHKWFCSAPMSDGFLTLARSGRGLRCFLVPRILPDGRRNGIRLMRLKDKLGDRSNGSAEIEYEDALAWPLGPEGAGIATILEAVGHTRLGTIGASLGIMRRALAEALHHAAHRSAFGRPLLAQPLMRAVLADLSLEYEAAVALAVRVGALVGAPDPAGAALARLGVAVAKYWLTKRTPAFVYECLECHGGNGYIEEGPMPRLFRQSPVNAIWEGSGNVIALDLLRTLQREPAARDAFQAELARAAGADPAFDAAAQALKARLSAPPEEAGARHLAERMALLLQAALLLRHTPPAVADAFVHTRLGPERSGLFGTLPPGADLAGILERQWP